MVFDITGFVNLFRNVPLENSMLVSVALIVIIAAAIAFIAKMLKQDLILAYIVAGILIGPLYFGLVKDANLIKGLAEIGITFLLFAAGLEMNLKKLRETMGTVVIAGIVQVVSVAAVSALVFIAFKFSMIESLILGVAIALSSTIVVTKILADKGEMNTLHARLIMGIMLVQDIIAIFALAMLSQTLSLSFAGMIVLKLLIIGIAAVLLHFTILKPLIRHAASSAELLLITSIAILFFFTGLAYFMSLSIAIGAFIAGITLANNPHKIEISARIRSLRDFFSVIFFVAIGTLLASVTKSTLLLLIPVLAILVIFEPIVTALVLRLRGYSTRTSMQAGFSFAQISEFSLILVIAALGAGMVSQRAFDTIVLAAVISIAFTPYTMKLGPALTKVFTKAFSFIKIPAHHEHEKQITGKKTLLIFGAHRMGSIFIKQLEKIKEKILVVDFDPDIAKALERQRIACIYGDASNPELLQRVERSCLPNLKIVISTIPHTDDNIAILKHFKKAKPNVFVALTAEKIHDALHLYELGADYVIVPQVISAEQSISMIKKLSKQDFRKFKNEHIAYLKDLHRALY